MGRKIEIEKRVLKQIDILTQICALIKKDKRPDGMTLKDWMRVLFYMNRKGWIYHMLNKEETQVITAVGGYRVSKVPDPKEKLVLPEEEEGDIFFIPFYTPKENKLDVAAVLRFLKKHPDIKSIAYEDDDGNIKQHDMYKKEINHEQEQGAIATTTTKV